MHVGLPWISETLACPKETQDAIRVGHLTPRTGFLGVTGAYAYAAAQVAVDEGPFEATEGSSR